MVNANVSSMSTVACRHCKTEASTEVIDLGSSPPSNAYVTPDRAGEPERVIPLRVLVCESCWLVQTEDHAAADEIFDDSYAYFSSYSTSWLEHARRYAEAMIDRFGLGAGSGDADAGDSADALVVEVASNDGYLLTNFVSAGIRCLGVEPTASTAAAARERGVPTVERFFGVDSARELRDEHGPAALMAANNVLAHVPDINDFVAGFAVLLAEDGVATFEFPHLMELIDGGQFDTIYHEHFSYLSLSTVRTIFEANGLQVFDVEQLTTHGGSLRVFAQPQATATRTVTDAVRGLLATENDRGMLTVEYYGGLQGHADQVRADLRQWLAGARTSGATVAAYGAAAKGNTLLNFAGVTSNDIAFVADANPHKQGQLLPASGIPIVEPEEIRRRKPDFVLVLPWNLMSEIAPSLSYVAEWGGALARAIPQLEIITASES